MTMPDIERTADRLREATKTYAHTKGASSELVQAAQKRYEEAMNWISQVVDKCKQEQLHLDAKQPAKEAKTKMPASSTFRSYAATADAKCGDPGWPGAYPQKTGGSGDCYSSTAQRLSLIHI